MIRRSQRGPMETKLRARLSSDSFAPAVAPKDADEEEPVIEHSLVLDTPVEEWPARLAETF